MRNPVVLLARREQAIIAAELTRENHAALRDLLPDESMQHRALDKFLFLFEPSARQTCVGTDACYPARAQRLRWPRVFGGRSR